MKRWLFRLAKLAILIAAVVAIRGWLQWDMATGAAPPLHGALIQGGSFSLDTPRKEPLVVHFWARWCPICKLERGAIEAIAEEHPVITVAMQSGTMLEVRRHMEKQGLRAPTIVDRSGSLSHNFGVSAVPATFVIDTNNQIRFVEQGFTSELGLRARLWLTKRFNSM